MGNFDMSDFELECALYDFYSNTDYVQDPQKLIDKLVEKGYVVDREIVSKQILTNAHHDIWFDKQGNKKKISDMDKQYKTNIKHFLEQRGFVVPSFFK